MDVRMPDGTIVRNVPDGTTQEELQQRYAGYMAAPKQEQPASNLNAQRLRSMIPPIAGGPLAVDALMGARQVWDAAAQLAARGAEGVANQFGGSPTLTKMREDTEAANKTAMDAYRAKFDPDNTTGASVARGVGQALVTAPITPALKAGGVIKSALGGAGIGGGAAALTPVYDAPEGEFWSAKGKQAAEGAAFGGALGGLFGALGRAAPTKQAKELSDAGVRVTPGRAAGGGAQRIEEGAESIPWVGDVIRGKHRQAVEDFNLATIQREALAPIGAKLDTRSAGRAAVTEAREKISTHYNATLDKIGRVDLDKTFSDEGTKVAQMTAELGESAQRQFLTILKNRVFDRITPAGTMSATTMKAVDSDIGRLAWGFKKSQDPNTRGLGDALREVQASLRRAVERSAGPELAAEVQKANTAWAGWVRIADASSRAGSKEGVFSPAALRGAVSKADKRGFTSGDARMQQWAEAAESVLGPKVPDSGSPYRLIGASGLGGLLLDPSVAATGATLAAAYSNPGMRVVNALAGKGEGAAAIAPYLGLLAAPGLSATQ